MSQSRPRSPLLSLGSARRKRPPATPARLAVGAVLFGLCALGAWLTIPRPDVRVINASGQAVTVTVQGGGAAATQTLGMDRVWAVDRDFRPGALHFRVKLPNHSEVSTVLASSAFPMRVAIAGDGHVAPR